MPFAGLRWPLPQSQVSEEAGVPLARRTPGLTEGPGQRVQAGLASRDHRPDGHPTTGEVESYARTGSPTRIVRAQMEEEKLRTANG